MALHTLRRRSAKHALHVASLTHNLSMPAAEWKAGGTVIDFDIGAIASLGPTRAKQHKSYSKQNSYHGKRTYQPFSQPVTLSQPHCAPTSPSQPITFLSIARTEPNVSSATSTPLRRTARVIMLGTLSQSWQRKPHAIGPKCPKALSSCRGGPFGHDHTLDGLYDF
jgi:hypothetical protein